ncbi:MAG: hypothetical protein ACRENU_07475 [Gemmatimonadaceae bacterium]
MADTAVTRSDFPPAAKPPCPATGNWAECSIFERLDRAGLAPRKDSVGTTEPPLEPSGLLFRVGNSELELYLYPDLAARRRGEATLDKTKYADPSAPLTMRPLPTLITSANLIAILHSRNEHQRERVADAVTAGPPQPVRP